MIGAYDGWLVLLSILVAITASNVALDLASRVTASKGGGRARYWLIGGAISMGTGIWSMHFIGMLAFRLPIKMSYDAAITLASLLIGILASWFSLYTVNRAILSTSRLWTGAVLMGFGIASMHYTGMAALEVAPPISYRPIPVILSILIAVTASMIALWSAFSLRFETILSAFWKKAGSAVIMGTAIYGAHYTGMTAAVFVPGSVSAAGHEDINNTWLAWTLGGFTMLFLLATLLASAFDAYIADLSAKYAERLRELNANLTKRGEEASRVNTLLQDALRRGIQAEDALQQAYDGLETRVAERTALLARSNRELLEQIAARESTERALRGTEQDLRRAIDERERLSRDLHDNIIQSIYAIGLRLEESQRLIQENPKDAAVQLETAIANLNDVLRDIREYIAGSGRRVIRGSQLLSELAQLMKNIDPAGMLRLRLDVDPAAAERLVPEDVQNLLQIAHEAMSNSLRHSHARREELALRSTDDGVRLEISDDGEGFDSQAPKRKGGGLDNMASRAKKIGAKLRIISSPGQGTRVVVDIPKEKLLDGGG